MDGLWLRWWPVFTARLDEPPDEPDDRPGRVPGLVDETN